MLEKWIITRLNGLRKVVFEKHHYFPCFLICAKFLHCKCWNRIRILYLNVRLILLFRINGRKKLGTGFHTSCSVDWKAFVLKFIGFLLKLIIGITVLCVCCSVENCLIFRYRIHFLHVHNDIGDHLNGKNGRHLRMS